MNENNSLNSTISKIDDNDFISIVTNQIYFGSKIIFIIVITCVLTFMFILKSKKKWLSPS